MRFVCACVCVPVACAECYEVELIEVVDKSAGREFDGRRRDEWAAHFEVFDEIHIEVFVDKYLR